jgi:hypothetical protein
MCFSRFFAEFVELNVFNSCVVHSVTVPAVPVHTPGIPLQRPAPANCWLLFALLLKMNNIAASLNKALK